MVYIYVLKDPITKEVRYVGKTTNPKTRLYNHIKMVNKGKTHCKSWIKSLLNQSLKPILDVIEVCSDNSSVREQYWIDYYKKLNTNLCNHTIGGECGKLSDNHIKVKEQQVLLALKLIKEGKEVRIAEQLAGLSHSYLYKIRKGEIDFLKHIQVPYFRNLKRNLIDRR